MTRPSPHDSRAVCPGCNVVHHVRLDGLLRIHRYPGFRDVCDGSHRPPHEVSSVPPDSG